MNNTDETKIQLAPGFWKTRAGDKVCVLGRHTMSLPNSINEWIGYKAKKEGCVMCWSSDGHFYYGVDSIHDIIAPWKSPVAPSHNPAKLTVEQVGEGYRLLDKDEIVKRVEMHPQIEKWNVQNKLWDNSGWYGKTHGLTFRTKLTREQLAELDPNTRPCKTRLLRVEELPPVCWVSINKSQHLVVCRMPEFQRLYLSGGEVYWEINRLQDEGYEWSSDLKTWNPFTTTEP